MGLGAIAQSESLIAVSGSLFTKEDMTSIVQNPTCGIDPGANGAIVILGETILTYKMPMKKGVYNWEDLIEILSTLKNIPVFLENPHAFHIAGNSTSFRFGFNCGSLQGALNALKIKHSLVLPTTWTKKIHSYNNFTQPKLTAKLKSKRIYNALLPGSKIKNDGIIDATLIALYGIKS